MMVRRYVLRYSSIALVALMLLSFSSTGTSAQTAKISFKEIYSHDFYPNNIYFPAWSPDQKYLAVGGANELVSDVNSGGYLGVLDTASKKFVFRDQHLPLSVITFSSWSHDSQWLAGTATVWETDERAIVVWNAQSGNVIKIKSALEDDLVYLSFSPAGPFMAYFDVVGTLYIWNVEKNQEAARIRDADVADFAWLSDGSGLVALSSTGMFTKYDTNIFGRLLQIDLAQIAASEGHKFYDLALDTKTALSPQGRYVAVEMKNEIGVFDIEQKTLVAVLPGESNIYWSPDSSQLSVPGQGAIFDLARNKIVPLETPKDFESVQALDLYNGWGPSSDFIVGTLFLIYPDENNLPSKTLYVWNPHTGQLIGEFPSSHKTSIRYIAVSPDGNYIATSDFDSVLKIWERQ